MSLNQPAADHGRETSQPLYTLKGQAHIVERDGDEIIVDIHGNELVVVRPRSGQNELTFHAPVLDDLDHPRPECLSRIRNVDDDNRWRYRQLYLYETNTKGSFCTHPECEALRERHSDLVAAREEVSNE